MEKVFTRSIVLLRTALKKYSSEKNVIFRNPLRTVTSSITQTSHQQRSNSELGKKLGTDCNSQFVIPHYLYGTNMDVLSIIARDMTVLEDFISEKEEVSFLEELEPYMKRLRYEFNHWDDAIHGYRETEKSSWNANNRVILQRVANAAFSREDKLLKHVHVLDINKDGYIKPHVDSVRFCGDTIAGLSLLSSSIMRLVCEKDKNKVVDVLLKQRSLYIMKGDARFKYTHEILPENLSNFKDMHVTRERRISIICRNEPSNWTEEQ